ncbi:MAG TPA: carboxymuconolactone decarboxylase family protein [Gammaproteobacteria bacterium]|nr:carboxymuconolactone decarboxylase family protein [Gammaproteobacteria bacterium]
MPRIRPINEKTADPVATEILEMVRKKMGSIPNLITTMVNSPAVARAYLGFSQALSTGNLPPRLREQIALLVGEANNCEYCVAAHTVLGKGAGLSEEETRNARMGFSSDRKERAVIEFARQVVYQRGKVSDEDVEQVRTAGYTDGEISEIVANVVLNVFTNYFNLVAGTEVDFPAAPTLATA